uniref:Uncharacterized protein n=1 Tax=Nelumbo nucifera TaxID=4432 RepID=A0A822Y5P9_NELNU|nr:TPA_asm: hypothetical protein HUJ06_029318 [Nelumbo nucifera]
MTNHHAGNDAESNSERGVETNIGCGVKSHVFLLSQQAEQITSNHLFLVTTCLLILLVKDS